jgi:type I site-specific restriction-modification system R (restriction) subunit
VHRAAALGVSLGRTNSQVINSVHLLKETDTAHNLFTLKRNKESLSENMDDLCSSVLEESNKLSQDLLDEELAETENHKEISVTPKKPIQACKKKNKEVKVLCRRSTRLKNKS